LPTVYKHDFYDVEPIFTTRKVRTTKSRNPGRLEKTRNVKSKEKSAMNVFDPENKIRQENLD
jgi:hypothetical protein